MSVSRHTLKQLKFILPGGLITYYLGSHAALWRIVNGEAHITGWGRYVSQGTIYLCHFTYDVGHSLAAYGSLGSAVLTVSLFMYILSIPLIQGQQPNVRAIHTKALNCRADAHA